MGKLTAKELQRRYRAGERNFARVDLSGESLRGMNLNGIDLSRSDLSHTDIRGTRFVNANLQETRLIQAKAGLQRRWLGSQLIIALLSAMFLNLATLWFSQAFISSSSLTPQLIEDPYFVYFVFTLGIALLMTLSMFAAVAWQGATFKALNIVLLLIAVAIAGTLLAQLVSQFIIVFAITSESEGAFIDILMGLGNVVGGGAAVGTVVGGVALAGALTGAVAITLVGTATGTDSLAVILAVFFAVVLSVLLAVAGSLLSPFAGATAFLSGYVAWHAIQGDEKFFVVRVLALALGSIGGTTFAGADLTGAYFTQTILKNTSFADSRQQPTILHNVRWKEAKNLDRARLGRSILQNPKVRELVLTLNGAYQNFSEINFRGVNLAGANLVQANFTRAILSTAVLIEADLQGANFTEASCIGTNFSRANFTGATLEAWNIESSTCLDGIHCDYVYLLHSLQERRPSSGSFGPSEFSKLFQEVLDTIDLIFQNGIDWKAFVQTFKDVQEQYSEAGLSIQSIENKGDGVVVVKLNAIPGTNKPVIHQSFNEVYQLALKKIEDLYRAQLSARNEQITDFREQVDSFRRQNADLHELAKLKARQPVNIDVKNVEKIVQGNDNSRTVNIGGNATGNVFQTGDGNTASIEFQQVTLPPPDRVNIQAELAALQAILAGLNDPVTTGIAAKLDAEAAKPAPDKSVVATTLETGLTYARNLQGFAEAIDKLRPHVQNAAGWLGEHGTKLLPLVGLVL